MSLGLTSGVGGPAKDPSQLRQQPDGSWLDPTTGTTYTDNTGATPVANPNLAQTGAIDQSRAGNFLAKAAQSDSTRDAVNAGRLTSRAPCKTRSRTATPRASPLPSSSRAPTRTPAGSSGRRPALVARMPTTPAEPP
jgi:hypothetical protein